MQKWRNQGDGLHSNITELYPIQHMVYASNTKNSLTSHHHLMTIVSIILDIHPIRLTKRIRSTG